MLSRSRLPWAPSPVSSPGIVSPDHTKTRPPRVKRGKPKAIHLWLMESSFSAERPDFVALPFFSLESATKYMTLMIKATVKKASPRRVTET